MNNFTSKKINTMSWEPKNFIETDESVHYSSILCRVPKTSTILTKNVFYKMPHCFMHRATNAYYYIGTRLVPPMRQITMSKRTLPDYGYTIVKPKNKIIGKDPKTGHNIYESDVVTPTGKELPLHEQSHGIVRDKETGKDVGVLTSAKSPIKGNIFVASENYKGDTLPDGKSKPQFYRAFETPRYSALSENMLEEPCGTAFAQKYEKELNEAVKKSTNYKKPALARVDKDSSQLYHENGLPIFDKDGKEIEYD